MTKATVTLYNNIEVPYDDGVEIFYSLYFCLRKLYALDTLREDDLSAQLLDIN